LAAPGTNPAIDPAATPPKPLPKAFLCNLILLICIGVGASAWILAYTDLFPAVGGLLALGGLFSWLAFVSKLLSKTVTEQLQDKFLAAFSKRHVSAILLGLALLLCVAASFFGAIQVEIQSTAQIRGFDLYREGSEKAEHRVITSAGSSNIPVVTFFGSSQWRVKIPGYPYQSVTVSPFHRPTLYLPQSFRRPVLLIVPGKDILDQKGYELRLTIDAGNGHTLVIPRYTWFAFWVGCGADVQVPAVQQAQLRSVFSVGEYPFLDPSLSTAISDATWLEKDIKSGPSSDGFEIEFPLAKTVHITAVDVSSGAKPNTIRIDKQIQIKDPRPTSFVQMEYLSHDDWKN
jgi:hypothetical protein